MADSGSGEEAFEKTEAAPSSQAGSSGLAAGTHLGKYRLDRTLGEGGMGVVWAAHDPDLERSVAIKVLRFEQASLQLRQRLLREARAMAKLKHPNVLTVYEVGTSGNRDYIAMELVDGQTLDAWFHHATYDERWDAIIAAGRGLAAAHAGGVVHRDFKPHNVLRSRDGRVLVTDFGLARGLVGETESSTADKALPDPAISPYDETITPAEAASKSTTSSEPGIDTPLTQTGALIGTPAYMAPEQFAGAAPDPRTDQFAFCVTAWQAITGERPFKGGTLEEMRKSVKGGVAHIPAKMPSAIRAVLTRGLDPDASKRWSSLEQLLDALEEARMRPIRRRRVAFAVFGIAAAIALFISMRRTSDDKQHAAAGQRSCDDGAALYAQTWTRDKERDDIASAFEKVGKAWIESYTRVCRSSDGKIRDAQLACLEGMRDDVSVLAFDAHHTATIDFKPWMLPHPKACETATPLSPALLPRTQPARDQALALLVSLRDRHARPDAKRFEKIESDARAAGGEPLVGSVIVLEGDAYLERGDVEHAREQYRRFLSTPPPHAGKDEALARYKLLVASYKELAEPRAKVPPDATDPHGKAVLHPELAGLSSAARASAGSDDFMLGQVGEVEAIMWAHAGQHNRYKNAYDEALEAAEQARRHFEAAGDIDGDARMLKQAAEIYLMRYDEHALDDALFAARKAEDELTKAGRPSIVNDILGDIAFERRDFNEAHRYYDRDLGWQSQDRDRITITGKVVGAGGKPATVVAYGFLIGDPARVNTKSASDYQVETEADGTFTMDVRPGLAIIAETKGMRSRPQVVSKKPMTLTLAATTSVSGTVSGRNLQGLRVYARYQTGEDTFSVAVPVERDGTYNLTGLIAGVTPTLELAENDIIPERVVRPGKDGMRWPYGEALDIIARGTDLDDAYVIRGNVVPKTGKQLEGSPVDMRCTLSKVNYTNTDIGRDVYRAGDRHCVVTGIADGPVTVCAKGVLSDKPVCVSLVVKTTVSIEYPDGRFAGGTTAVLIAP